MNQRFSKRGFHWRAVIAPLILWGAVATVAYSDGGHESSPAPDKTGKTDAELAQFSASLDSVYAVIGAAYRTIEPSMRASCYDCHSSQTVFPWYHAIPGIKQMIESDIAEARQHLDLDQGFPVAGHASQLEQLQAIRKEIAEAEMPPFSYRMIHWDTKIEGEQQLKIFSWIDQSSDAIQEVYGRYQMPVPKESEHSDDSGSDDDD